jgi:hypothetical protein
MSREPIQISGEYLIEKGVSLCGFWLGRWTRSVSTWDHENMLEILAVPNHLLAKKDTDSRSELIAGHL